MILSHDRADAGLRSAHAAFLAAAQRAERPAPLRMAIGVLRGGVLLVAALLASSRGPDPIDVEPRILAR